MTTFNEMIDAMKCCEQSKGFSVYEHGVSVAHFFTDLISETPCESWKLPEWYSKYKKDLFENLHNNEIIQQYLLFHDCGKPFCHQIDENGKSHFPDHARVSGETWKSIGGDP